MTFMDLFLMTFLFSSSSKLLDFFCHYQVLLQPANLPLNASGTIHFLKGKSDVAVGFIMAGIDTKAQCTEYREMLCCQFYFVLFFWPWFFHLIILTYKMTETIFGEKLFQVYLQVFNLANVPLLQPTTRIKQLEVF